MGCDEPRPRLQPTGNPLSKFAFATNSAYPQVSMREPRGAASLTAKLTLFARYATRWTLDGAQSADAVGFSYARQHQ